MHEPLGSVAQDLSRYHNKRIIISDARLSAMPFTGTVFSTRIDDALSALESVFPLEVKERSDAIELTPRG
jgi:transmembrane sensor